MKKGKGKIRETPEAILTQTGIQYLQKKYVFTLFLILFCISDIIFNFSSIWNAFGSGIRVWAGHIGNYFSVFQQFFTYHQKYLHIFGISPFNILSFPKIKLIFA